MATCETRTSVQCLQAKQRRATNLVSKVISRIVSHRTKQNILATIITDITNSAKNGGLDGINQP